MTEEKQIDEMARIISEYDECGNCKVCIYHNCCSSEYHATNLYNAGYRKQVVGKWETFPSIGSQYRCSVCKKKNERKSVFCPHCGAKMK